MPEGDRVTFGTYSGCVYLFPLRLNLQYLDIKLSSKALCYR